MKQLKHYRWVRNQIAHDPNCYEENMCDSADTQWIIEFHSRIMNQMDPLALYCKATQSHPKTVPDEFDAQEYLYHGYAPRINKKTARKSMVWIVFLVCSFLIVAVVYILFTC